ncbi:hypothetical protein QSJ18_15220 [Gordonia sp. ABSL1-1]|uniref:hypothetical protein n=1 Tax=Gordonia sp. ABSL1-1 TaxID=3053923 RepID=UPI00257267CA|nr:hypothetical protein [Gordonia sp. ABSL1-1]MDL9938103.1 hypothetical protein [Gordonia sp. ABSL1-1]
MVLEKPSPVVPVADRSYLYKFQRLSAWSGFLVMAVVGVCFFMLSKVQPPIDPEWTAEHVKEWMVDNRTGILWTTVICSFIIPLEYFFVVTTSWQMRRIEGCWGFLSMNQAFMGVVAPIGFMYPMFIISAAAYRAEERSAEILQLFTDLFYFSYVGFAFIFSVQCVVLGIAVLIDKRSKPVFPRWYAYLNFILAVVLAPGAFVFVFTSGPLAWNGLFAFWIPCLAYTVWKVATPLLLLKAVDSEVEEAKEGPIPVVV